MKKNPYRKPDRFTDEAKKAGFPARSVFKLQEIDRRAKLLRPGLRVLDLGAAPGSWSLYAAQRIGPKGKLVGVDLSPLSVTLPANAVFFEGDAYSEDAPFLALGPFDLVLSDMAPKTTGNRLGDQTRSFELFMHALLMARRLLVPGGNFCAKIFMGEDFPEARRSVQQAFDSHRLIRPEGTRSVSYEIFVLGLGKKRESS